MSYEKKNPILSLFGHFFDVLLAAVIIVSAAPFGPYANSSRKFGLS